MTFKPLDYLYGHTFDTEAGWQHTLEAASLRDTERDAVYRTHLPNSAATSPRSGQFTRNQIIPAAMLVTKPPAEDLLSTEEEQPAQAPPSEGSRTPTMPTSVPATNSRPGTSLRAIGHQLGTHHGTAYPSPPHKHHHTSYSLLITRLQMGEKYRKVKS
ncbi:hypothetical protein ILYODFUR_022090 [Ilyodon furcidens]|uniref:Uncharacterized protein n=1 Tax=Ilyodon furcidens TaxID=33524 RepID=A0ABV0VG13_9TELE